MHDQQSLPPEKLGFLETWRSLHTHGWMSHIECFRASYAFYVFFHRRIVCSIINIHRQNLTFVKNIKFPSVIVLCIVCPRPHTLLSCRPSTHPTTSEPPSSSVDTSSVLMPFLKNPHAIHPDQDTNGCLMKAANEKSSCAELRGNGGKWR